MILILLQVFCLLCTCLSVPHYVHYPSYQSLHPTYHPLVSLYNQAIIASHAAQEPAVQYYPFIRTHQAPPTGQVLSVRKTPSKINADKFANTIKDTLETDQVENVGQVYSTRKIPPKLDSDTGAKDMKVTLETDERLKA